MREKMLWIAACCALVLAACSDAAEQTPDGGQPDASPHKEAGTDAPVGDKGPAPDQQQTADQQPQPDTLAATSEQEPNDGTSKTEYNTVAVPAVIKGSIGKADDIDIFGLAAPAGARYEVRVKGDGTLQPHLAIFDMAQQLPAAVSRGATVALAEYYTLQATDPLLIGVRDRRNVGSSSQHVGGPAFTYTLTIKPLTRAPIPITVGASKGGTLAPAGTVRVYAFPATKGVNLDLDVLVAPSADIDARLSLFHLATKAWIKTNELPTSQNAKISASPMPLGGTFHAIVENVADNPTAFGYTFKITQK